MTNTPAAIEARRKALMESRRVAIDNRDWNAMNDITKRLAKLPVKGEKDYPRASFTWREVKPGVFVTVAVKNGKTYLGHPLPKAFAEKMGMKTYEPFSAS